VLKDFAFAILIGIGISAFSTIFIAAPFLAVLLERAPEYKGRTERAMRRAEEAPEPGEKLVPVAAGVDGGGDGDAPVPATTAPVTPATPASSDTKRERRRQRRRARPHGRAR
jgi:hypothetical protein